MFGPILENQQQAAVWNRLCQHAQMGAVGQKPVLLFRIGRAKPAFALCPPFREIPDLWQFVVFADPVEHAAEFGLFGKPLIAKREQALERQIGKTQTVMRIELCDARRHHVQQIALRIGHQPKFAARVAQFLHVDRQPGHADIAQRYIEHAQMTSLTVERRRYHALGLQSLGLRLCRERHCRRVIVSF